MGENRSLPDILCVVSSPNALLKVFPLRACASLNVVIMHYKRKVFSSFLVCLLQTQLLQKHLGTWKRALHMCAHHRGPVDSPSFPGLDTHSEHPWVPVAVTLGLPSDQVIGRQPPIEITLVNQSLMITSQCFPVLIYQLFQTISKTLEQWLSSLDTTELPRELYKLLMPDPILEFLLELLWVKPGHQKF